MSPDASRARGLQRHDRGVPGTKQPGDGAAGKAAPRVGDVPELEKVVGWGRRCGRESGDF